MAEASTWTSADVAGVLRVPTDTDDKYSRGVVGLRTGSTAYPGAAVLGVEAAWRAGTGMVRYVGPARPTDLVLARRPETVPAEGRVQAWVIGSGTDAAARSDDETGALRGILSGEVPVIVDAGALDLAVGASAPRVLTPHGREHDRLRGLVDLPAVPGDADDEARAAAALETACRLDAVVLLKGATTLVAAPTGWIRRTSAGTPWLATAGTGDVLAGTIGAVVAGLAPGADAEALAAAAVTGAWVHQTAAHAASSRLGPIGGPITALDIAAALPEAVASVASLG